MISPDAPINNRADDTLGRGPFAKALAEALLNFGGDDSFVIGVHGKWGTGKSSVLNLLVEELSTVSAKKSQTVDVMRFNPWNFSDQNQLVLQFLRQFAGHLQSLDKGTRAKLKVLLEKLDKYTAALAPPLEAMGMHGKLISTVIGTAKRAVLGGQDVDSLFLAVSEQLRALKRKTVVIVDDIDRLTASEIRQVFQLVKLSARFPYVVYVLAFDRDAVADALSEHVESSGEEYLEKIVQVSFDLPPINADAMSLMINQAIEKLVEAYPSPHFDNQRYAELFHSGFRRNFESLRDLRRFINGLEFGFGMIAREVNGVDFIGIEALRVFYPKVFDVIRRNKETFAGHIDEITRDKGSEAFRSEVDQKFKSAGASVEDSRELVMQLFPKLQYAYGNTLYGHNSETLWEKSQRVCTSRYFDFYFQLVVPEGEISASEIEAIIESTAKQNDLIKNLLTCADSGRLKPALESFRARFKTVPTDYLPNVVGALLEVGDRAKHEGSMIAGRIPEFLYVSWALFDCLDLIRPQDRVAIIEKAFRVTDGVGTAADLIIAIERINAEHSGKYGEFDTEALSKLKKLVVTRIQEIAPNQDLLLRKDLLPKILYSWRSWGGESEENAYVAKLLSSDQHFVRFLDKFIYQTTSIGGGEKVVRTRSKFSIGSLAKVAEIDTVTARLASIDDASLSSHNKSIVEVARKSFDKFKQSGRKPEEFENQPDFED